MPRPSQTSSHFSQVPKAEIPRSSFDRSSGYKTTFNAGVLVPFFLDEALPGDTFNLRTTAFSRLATPINPYFDNASMDTFFFAVPLRLVWDNFQKFMGEQEAPGDSTDFLVPQMIAPAGGYLNGSIHDYFGLPTEIANFSHSALFHRAYNLIFNEWFRDQNLINPVPVPKGDGPDEPTDYQPYRRGKRHDYFTSCLPFPQKGPSVDLPLGESAPITGLGAVNQNYPDAGEQGYEATGQLGNYAQSFNLAVENLRVEENPELSGFPNIFADLSEATAATINELRQAFQIQRLYERDARGGTRYTEIVRAHFGVSSDDARLQRPEYLGGGSTPINITPIPQTSETDPTGNDASPQGNLAAVGTATVRNNGFVKSFTEHTIVIGIVCVRADLTYQQGLPRMFSRQTRFDYFWPALAHIGEQAVLNKEIFTSEDNVENDGVFGYQERFAEYRYRPSQITGQFRSNYAETLDSWHLAQNFENLPTLNSTFIGEDPPFDRVIAVQDEPHFLFDSFTALKCARPMPLYSVPGMIDHF